MLNKIFIVEENDGSLAVFRSVYSPKGSRAAKAIQVSFDNIFDPETRTYQCKTKQGVSVEDRVWAFIEDWAKTNILINPKNRSFDDGVYYILNPENILFKNNSIGVVCGTGTVSVQNVRSLVAYNDVVVTRLTRARVDAWDNVEIVNKF